MGGRALRGSLKAILEGLAGSPRLTGALLRIQRPVRAILAYHNVVPDGAPLPGERPLHIPRAAFARHLDLLESQCCVVPLMEVLTAAAEKGRPIVAVTFDDAYRGALEIGLAELRRRAIPATVFVAPGLLGSRACWWDVVAAGTGGLLEPEFREEVLTARAGRSAGALELARARGCALDEDRLPAFAGIATEAELIAAAAQPGVTVGSHSWSHANLGALPGDEVLEELRAAAEWLARSVPGRSIPWVAYPYGRSSSAARAAVEEAGLRAGVAIQGGRLRPDSSRWELPRISVASGLSARGLALRLAGVVGA